MRIEKLQALDVVLEALELELTRALALCDRFFLVNDLEVELPMTRWSVSRSVIAVERGTHDTYAVVLARERRVLFAQRQDDLRELKCLALCFLERALDCFFRFARAHEVCEHVAHERRALDRHWLRGCIRHVSTSSSTGASTSLVATYTHLEVRHCSQARLQVAKAAYVHCAIRFFSERASGHCGSRTYAYVLLLLRAQARRVASVTIAPHSRTDAAMQRQRHTQRVALVESSCARLLF